MIFDTIGLFIMIYVYTNFMLLLWTHETVLETLFMNLSDFRYPIKLNHAVSTNSGVHSKLRSLCKSIFCFHCVERLLHINGNLNIFCNFYFCTFEEKNVCGHSCVTRIFMFFLQGKRELNFL